MYLLSFPRFWTLPIERGLNGCVFYFDLFIMCVNILLLALAEIIMSEHS